MRHEVFWYTLKSPAPTPLSDTVRADVVVVGGGMMGLSCAHQLSKYGLKVVILEKDFCGAGATGKSSGFITPDSELSLAPMIKRYGQGQARKLWEFACGGVSRIRENIEEFALPCDYQKEDSLFVANAARAFRTVRKEHRARRSFEFESTLYRSDQLSEALGAQQLFGGVRYGDTFSMNSYLYAQELKQILSGAGIRIFEHSLVTRISQGVVETSHGRVLAGHVIVCTDRALPQQGFAKSDVYSAQTFLALSRPLPSGDVQKIFPNGQCMVWDTDLIYQYFRLTPDRRVLLGASSLLYTYLPFRKRHTNLVEKKMYRYWKEKFPSIDIQFEYFWPGLIGVSQDFLPVIGTDADRRITFAGGAAGLPWAASLGMYLADHLVKSRRDFDAVFSVDRPSPLGDVFNRLLPKPLAFAAAQGIVKLL